MLLSGLADATMASRVLKPNKMLAPNTMCVQCDESVANCRMGPGRKWKLRDQRDPGGIYHRLLERHQAIYAMDRTKLRKDGTQCGALVAPQTKINQGLSVRPHFMVLSGMADGKNEIHTGISSAERQKNEFS